MKPKKINWLDWGFAAFERAKKEKKLVLLSISAVWCHWCHVMDRETYDDDDAANFINKNFIPVRVDNDKNPEINARYNMGGWPSTVFLTSEGEVVSGGTYMPPEHFLRVAHELRTLYEQNPEHLTRVQENAAAQQGQELGTLTKELNADLVTEIADHAVLSFDLENGGFGTQPKFPQTEPLRLFLDLQVQKRNHKYGVMLKKTLDTMHGSEMYDHEEGGFFRYATRQNWSVPHYEKMLDDNANLLSLYLDAHLALDKKEYAEVARDILKYLDTKLAKKEGGFCGSQDADEEYYKLTIMERKKRKEPFIDPVMYTDTSAKMAAAYAKAGAVLGEEKWLKHAVRTLEFLLEKCQTREGICHYYTERRAHNPGWLSDIAALLDACLEVAMYARDSRFVQDAVKLVEQLESKFWDAKENGFWDLASTTTPLGKVAKREKPFQVNEQLAQTYLKLYTATHDDKYFTRAEEILNPLTAQYTQWGLFASGFARVVNFYAAGMRGVHIVGTKKETAALWRRAIESYGTYARILDTEKDAATIKALHYDKEKIPIAIPCLGKVCARPVRTVAELGQALAERV